MKLAASLVALALVASPAVAQDNGRVTHVHSTTRHIHATNVPMHHAAYHHMMHHRRMRHHAMYCRHVRRHGESFCARTHHDLVRR
jgi:hypothetical protein